MDKSSTVVDVIDIDESSDVTILDYFNNIMEKRVIKDCPDQHAENIPIFHKFSKITCIIYIYMYIYL